MKKNPITFDQPCTSSYTTDQIRKKYEHITPNPAGLKTPVLFSSRVLPFWNGNFSIKSYYDIIKQKEISALLALHGGIH